MAEQFARNSNDNSEPRCSTHCEDVEPMGESRAVETGKEEESLKSELPTVEMNPKDPMNRAKQ